MLAGLKTIVFDWGGTLAHVARQEETRGPCASSAADHLRAAGYGVSDAARDDLHRRLVDTSALHELASELAELDTARLLSEWGAAWDLTWNPAEAEALALAFWRPWVGCLDPIDGARAVLVQLRDAGWQLGLLSNCAAHPEMCRVELGRQGFSDLLAFALFTSELGVRKPHPEAYRAALARAGALATPGETLYVGDTPHADIDGPQAAGMHAALVRTGNGQVPVSTLAQAPAFVLESVVDLPAALAAAIA